MLRKVFAAVAACESIFLLIGCVRPQADYIRAADLVRERVPATQIYNPNPKVVSVPEVTQRLTVDQAVQRALLANRDLQVAFADIGVARADLVQSALLKNPTLAFSARFPSGGGRSDVPLDLAEDIADLWQIPIRHEIARNALDETVFKVVEQVVDTAVSTKQAYHRLQTLRQALQIARDNVQIAQRSDDAALARFQAGQTGKTDADLARTSLLQARFALIDIQRQIRVAQDDLALLLAMDRWPDTGVILDPLPAPRTAPEETAAVQIALSQRLDLQAQAKAVQAAHRRVTEEWLRIFPSFETGFSMERLEARNPAPGEISVVAGPSINLPLPIFDQNQAQIAKAVILRQQEQRRYEGMLLKVQRDVRAAMANYQAAAAQVEFYQLQLLPQLQQSLETATASYRAGTTNIVAVLDAQRSLVSTTSDLNKAQSELLQTADELEKALGGPLLWPQATPTSQPVMPSDGGVSQ